MNKYCLKVDFLGFNKGDILDYNEDMREYDLSKDTDSDDFFITYFVRFTEKVLEANTDIFEKIFTEPKVKKIEREPYNRNRGFLHGKYIRESKKALQKTINKNV